jgi:hypothetical protein
MSQNDVYAPYAASRLPQDSLPESARQHLESLVLYIREETRLDPTLYPPGNGAHLE